MKIKVTVNNQELELDIDEQSLVKAGYVKAMMKPAKKTKAMHQWDMALKESAQSLENQRCKNCGVYPGSHHTDRCESLLEIRKRAWKEYKKNDKVIWEGREWLRSISDPHHGWHVFMVLVLIAALIIAVVVL